MKQLIVIASVAIASAAIAHADVPPSLSPVWSFPHLSIELNKIKGEQAAATSTGTLFDMNDFTIAQGKSFLKTHEVIFWLKGSVVF